MLKKCKKHASSVQRKQKSWMTSDLFEILFIRCYDKISPIG
jgi:hypothetical protein